MDKIERNNLIMELHSQNMPLREIGEYVNLTGEAVRNIITANGGSCKGKGAKYEAIMYKFLAVLGDEEKELEVLGDIKKLYFVSWIKRTHNIEIYEIYREQRKNRVLELNKEGLNAKQIADDIGCSRALVLKTLHNEDIYTKLSTEETRIRNEKIRELFFVKKMSREDIAEACNTSYANVGLVITNKHYVKYSPEYYAARHERREATKKRFEEIARVEELVINLFKEHKSIPRIEVTLKAMSEICDRNRCYRILYKYGYSTGKGKTYKQTYALV